MFNFLRKAISFGCCSNVRSFGQTSYVGFVRNPNVCHLRLFSVSISDKEQSFVVSYLISSLGFSPKAALSASKRVKFHSPKKPDKTIEFFKGHGFTPKQISGIVRSYPQILVYDAEKIILPKLEFLASKGISGPEFAIRLSSYPALLRCSLAGQIMPAYEFFRNFFQSDEMMIRTVRRSPQILAYNIKTKVRDNINILRQHGLPDSKISTMIYVWSMVMDTSSVRFGEIVKEVAEMGFNSSKKEFILAVLAVRLKIVKSKWESKVNAYKKWGLSDEEVSKAFRKSPWCMLISENKITALMDFFVTELGLQPCNLVNRPIVLTLSLEKRIIPRVSFYQVLWSRGLVGVNKKVSLWTLLQISEKMFLQKFVTPYAEEAPELLKLYNETSALSNRPGIGKICRGLWFI